MEVETDHNYFICAGGKEYNVHNSSKTYSLIQSFIIFAFTHVDRAYRVVIARKKSTWLSSTVWQDFNKIITDMGLLGKVAKVNKSSRTITIRNTSIEFMGLDDVQRLHGLTTDIFWINEAMEATKDDFDQLEQRTTMFSVLDYNPSAEEHWIYDTVITRPDCYFDHSTMLDNPFIPENSRRKILSYEPTEENYRNGTADIRKWKIYGLGQRASIEGLVYDGYEIVTHIPEEVDRRWYAVDFGYSNDPTAIIEVGYNGRDLYMDEVAYSSGLLTEDIRDILISCEKRRRLKIISESADPRLVAELQKGKRDDRTKALVKPALPIFPVRKYAGSIEAGIDFIKGRNIKITSRSVNVKKELDNYTYQQTRDGKWLNIPVDDFNHALDALRYVCLEELMAKNSQPVDLGRVAAALNR